MVAKLREQSEILLPTPSSSMHSFLHPTEISDISRLSINTGTITLLHQIQQQNKEILQLLNRRGKLLQHVDIPKTPVSLPVISLDALQSLEEWLRTKENFTELTSYLSSLGGRDSTSMTYNILKRCLCNEVASNYSFMGKGLKKPFASLLLKGVVLGAVKERNPLVTERAIEDNIKVWLKHSPQRLKMERAKRQN